MPTSTNDKGVKVGKCINLHRCKKLNSRTDINTNYNK